MTRLSATIGRATLAGVLLLGLAGEARPQSKQLEKGRLRLEVVLEQEQDGKWAAVDPATVFRAGDRLRFLVTSNFPGYLYVTNQGTSGAYATLYPSDDAGTENRIEAGKAYRVPETDGAFRIGGPAGHDIVYWMMTPKKIGGADPYRPLPKPPASGGAPFQMLPRCDETILRARGDCIDPDAGLQGPEDDGTLASRQLVFVQNAESAVVSAPPRLDGPVVFEFRVSHR